MEEAIIDGIRNREELILLISIGAKRKLINPSCDLQTVDAQGEDEEYDLEFKAHGFDGVNRFG